MTKKTLLTISAVADSFDLVTGLMPGPWSLFVDIPVTIIHFFYAGPRAFITLLEYAPVVGVLPIFTIAAMTYDKTSDEKPHQPHIPRETVIDVEIVSPCKQSLQALPPPLPNAPRKSVEARLSKLAGLQRRGLISQQEYTAMREELLREI